MADEQGGSRIVLHVAGKSDVGLVREHNEDSFVVVDLEAGKSLDVDEMVTLDLGKKGAVLVVCDGMGGAAAGEVASAMAIETVREVMLTGAPEGDTPAERQTSFARRLRQAAYAANERIFDAARKDPSKVGMGTTMTAVGVVDQFIVMAQVGDSRAYLLRDGVLVQCTRDQSLVNELLETGQISEEQAVMFEHSNVILQALGVQPEVEVLLSTVELRKGDRVVVCSDGLTGVVPDEEVGALAAVSDDVAEGCRLLIEVARGAGGPDNITAIVARFEGEGLGEPTAKDPPVRYERWRLDETDVVNATGATQRNPIISGQGEPRKRRVDFARTFFSATLLFALALGGLIIASILYRSAPSQSCTIVGAAAGLAVRVDGFDTGARTHAEGVSVRLPPGRHEVRLRGRGAPEITRTVDVSGGAACTVRFDTGAGDAASASDSASQTPKNETGNTR